MSELDADETAGKTAAIIAIQSALVARLITRNVITREEAAEMTAAASAAVETMDGLSADAKIIGEAVLKGFASSWLKGVTRN